MAVKLNYNIPQSNFELIRDVIGSLLKIEMDNQAVSQSNNDYTAAFYTERFTPVDKSEGNVITVNVAGGPLDDQTPISQTFNCTYNIDVFANAITTPTNTGYYNSGVKIQRLAGLVRHILQSPYYDRLGLSNGIIQRRSVGQIQFGQINDEQDASSSRMARITLNVSIYEQSNEISPITLAGYDTIIKIAETEKGFLLTYNNE